jgi:GDPmannose 4,6-dehydratase/GDP-L-fucose synthase
MVGSAMHRRLQSRSRADSSIELLTSAREDLDLTEQAAVRDFFGRHRPDVVILAAARVGGILANSRYPAEFIRENLAIELNVIHEAWAVGVRRLLFLGSSCIYPRQAAQPMPESALMTGPLEPTNEAYAVAKIAGIKLCESYRRQYGADFRSVMPTNLYGPGDHFHPENSHVIPALIRRFDEARAAGATEVLIWGTGRPYREFLHVDDMADASLHVLDLPEDEYWGRVLPAQSHVNVGSGAELSIAELAQLVSRVTGFEGAIRFDASKPDGAPRKLLDNTLITQLGWRPRIGLEEGLRSTYEWYRTHASSGGA